MKATALESFTVRDVLVYRGNPRLSYSIGEDNTVEEALALMLGYDIVSLPVFKRTDDCGKQLFIDIVSLYDLRDHITQSPTLETEVHFQLLSGRPSGSVTVLQDTIAQVVQSRKHASQVISADAPLEELLRLFTNDHENDDIAETTSGSGYLGDDDREHGVCGLTQYDVVRFIQSHNHQLGRQLDVTAIDIATTKTGGVTTLHDKDDGSSSLPHLTIRDSALSAMKRLRDTHTSALPVVDYDGRLVTEVAGTSLRSLTTDKIGLLGKPVLAFMFGLHLPITSPYVIHSNFTLSQVMAGLLRMNSRRAWLVDGEERPVAVISLTDVLEQFL
ncbi:hypothetical protein GQ54DRAFT_112235 [Martensiomyces pterosporus]|nr:hypothetical protein GQ54DRAFT_112235 [Martensiomyces pterosporus]